MDIDTFLAKKKELDDQLKAHAKDMVQDLFRAFFSENPGIKAVGWSQYTPYFNDGEPCEFGVNDPEFFTEAPEEDWSPGYGSEGDVPNYGPDCPTGVRAFCDRFGKLTCILESLGDHSQILVTNEDGKIKVQVDSYDHE